jgi:hypothetical protein
MNGIVLEPKRFIKYKAITGHGGFADSSSKQNPNYKHLQPNYEINDNKLVYSFRPSNLYFEEDVLPILKKCLLSNIDVFTYHDIHFKIIDYVFFQNKSVMFECGCHYFNSKVLDVNEGVRHMPNHFSYGNEFHYHCTSEWYLNIEFGSISSPISSIFIFDIV